MWGHSSVGRALEWHSRGRRFDSAWLHQTLLASFIALSGSENMGLRRHLAALPWIIVRLRVHDHGSPKRSEEAYPQPFESAFPRFSSQPHETGSQSLAPSSTFKVLYGEGSRAAAGRRRAPFDDCADVCRVPFRRWAPILSRRELDSLMTAPAGQLRRPLEDATPQSGLRAPDAGLCRPTQDGWPIQFTSLTFARVVWRGRPSLLKRAAARTGW